jgi:hypothetical protein
VLNTPNWNNLANASGSQANLIDDSGAATTASVDWTSNNTWRSGGRNLGSGGHAQLMSGYLDYLDSTPTHTPPVITVSGLDAALGAPSYQVYVYVQGDSSDSRSGEWSVNGTFLPLTDDQPFSAANEYVVGENYLLFSGVTGDQIVVSSMASFRAPINGVEIVGVPEPSSLLLLVLVGLIVGAAGRRRG